MDHALSTTGRQKPVYLATQPTDSGIDNYPQFLDEKEVAALLNVSVALVRKWRARRTGPKVLKIGGRLVRYELNAVLAFARQGQEA